MNYTEKYHLPQWEETDRIMRTDFNQMCADMEAGLKQNAQAAAAAKTRADEGVTNAAAAQTAAQTAQSAAAAAHSAANAAQAAADAAQASANNAQATASAAYSPGYQPYVIGSYVGVGQETELSVNVGFKPRFLILSGQKISTNGYVENSGLIGEGTFPDIFSFTSTGFTIKAQAAPSVYWAHINEWNIPYRYIAFR